MEVLKNTTIFLVGIIFGSFFNVCIYRIPRSESIIFPPSHCTNCGMKLKWYELLPVFSWVFLGGKCHTCKRKISIQYPLVELSTGILFLLLIQKFGFSGQAISYVFLVSLLIIITVIDLQHQIIPDELIIVGAITGVLLSLIKFTVSWIEAALGLLTGSGTFLIVVIIAEKLLKKEGMGGGDIKLMGMIGIYLGWKLTALSMLLSIYAGGIIGGLLVLLKVKKRDDAIPYGPFIAAGTIISIFFGNDIIRWYLQSLM